MGDIVELLEYILNTSQVSKQVKGTNLYTYLLEREYLSEVPGSNNDSNATLTTKGQQYLDTLYLLRLHQTPNNFWERDHSDTIVRRLEHNGYITMQDSKSAKSSVEITADGESLLAHLADSF